MLHLQGDLQAVFDTLYDLGIIEPVLARDWKDGLLEIEGRSEEFARVVQIVNSCGQDRGKLREELEKLDQHTLEVLAMEVAREYAGYHTRQSSLH